MKKSVLAFLGFGAACSACCLPFLAPLLVASGLSGVLAFSIAGVSLDYVLCVLGPWIAGAGLLLAAILLVARRRARPVCECATTCIPGKC